MLGIYYRTIYRNQETGETKFQITPKEQTKYAIDGLLTCYGKISIYTKDIPIEIEGKFDESKNVFMVISDNIPTKSEYNTIALLEYIASGLTENQKTKISDYANHDLFNFIKQKDCADKIMSVFGDDAKASRMTKTIINKIKKLKEQGEITRELMSYGVPIDRIEALYKKEITLNKLDKNPYNIMLKFDVPIDNIEMYASRRLHISAYSITRLCGFLYDAMIYNSKSGHTCCTLKQLVKIMNMRIKFHGIHIIEVDEALVNLCIDMLSDEVAYREVDGIQYIYIHHIWEEETKAVSHLMRLQSNQKQFNYNTTIDEVETDIGIKYNVQQRDAFSLLFTSGVKILTGPPGSGKTAIIRGLINYFKSNGNDKIKLAATTGRAARVMGEACGDDAETANLMLNVRPFDNSVQGRNLNNPVEADFIIVDEVSMLGLQLFSILVGAIKSGSILLLVGDEDQLQSVEYGNVLHDLIASGNIEVYRLTEILRQSGTICDNAKLINDGQHNLKSDASFSIRRYSEPQDAINDLKQIFKKESSQILSPMKTGVLSTFSLNCIFQDNSAMFAAAYGKKIFRIGDRVIMTKTNYDKGYINGDIGKVVGKNQDETIVVKFDSGNITLERQDLHDMELADAITVHKSQGSECDGIHIILPMEAKHMMTRRILYTGVTRAKKYVRIYAIENALELAIDDTAERNRVTLLDRRLKLANSNQK